METETAETNPSLHLLGTSQCQSMVHDPCCALQLELTDGGFEQLDMGIALLD